MTARGSGARVGPGIAAGVTEDMICEVVHTFYAAIRGDPSLGPIFNDAIAEEAWPAHLSKLCDFWSSVLLMSGRYKGAPIAVHVELAEITPAHFDRWLLLFRQTADTLCPPPAAALFITKSEIIAQSLQRGIAVARGESPAAANGSQR